MSQNCGTVVHSFKQDVEHVRHQQQLARVPGIDAVGQCSWNALFYFFFIRTLYCESFCHSVVTARKLFDSTESSTRTKRHWIAL